MNIDFSKEERERLTQLCCSAQLVTQHVTSDVTFLAQLLSRILHAAESEEEHRHEQEEI